MLPTDAIRAHARLVDDVACSRPDEHDLYTTPLMVEVGRASAAWPDLVVTMRCTPGPEQGFFPGAIVIPETRILLIGAGEQLVAYDLDEPRRLWLDAAQCGFWGWTRHADVVVMSAELELAAFDLHARKLWTMFVEPPWTFEVTGTQLELNVMDRLSSFDLLTGPGLPPRSAR